MTDPAEPEYDATGRSGQRFLATEARGATILTVAMLVPLACLNFAVAVFDLTLTGEVGLFLIYAFSGVLFIAMGVATWQLTRLTYTEVTEAGVVTRRYRTLFVGWNAVTDIKAVRVGRFVRVRLGRAKGRDLLLWAPVTLARRPDPRFAAEVETMRARWLAATGRGTSRSWHPAG